MRAMWARVLSSSVFVASLVGGPTDLALAAAPEPKQQAAERLIAATVTVRMTVAATAPQPERWNFWRSLREFNSPMRHLLLSDILIRFCERVPYAWVVIFAMDYIGVSGRQVGILTTVEMLAATVCIIPASYYADRHGRQPFVIVTFIMFTLFPISLLLSRSFSALVIAFVIRGLKEFGDTSRKALVIGYSDPDRRGQMVGTYYLVRDSIVSTGAILGAYLWKLGPGLNFAGAAALGAAGTIFYVTTVRQSRQSALNDLKKQLEMHRNHRR